MENLGLFGRLPGELRNVIYDLALTHDLSNDRKASAALLSTCKQIHREARDILYDNGTFTLNALFDGFRVNLTGDVAGFYVGSVGHAWEPPVGGANPPKLPRESKQVKKAKRVQRNKDRKKDWETGAWRFFQRHGAPKTFFPAWAWRMRRIVVTMSDCSSTRAVTYFVLALFHFLNAECSMVKEVDLSIRAWEDPDLAASARCWIGILYPIAKIPRKVDLTLNIEDIKAEEYEPRVVREGLINLRARDDPDWIRRCNFDPIQVLQNLKVDICDILGSDTHPGTGDRPWQGYLHDVAQELRQLICHILPMDMPGSLGYYQEGNELDLMVYTSILKEVLRVLRTDPDEDEQHRYVVCSAPLQKMQFTIHWLDTMRDDLPEDGRMRLRIPWGNWRNGPSEWESSEVEEALQPCWRMSPQSE